MYDLLMIHVCTLYFLGLLLSGQEGHVFRDTMTSPSADHSQSEYSLKSVFVLWNSLLGSQLGQMAAPESVWTLVSVALWACRERLGSRGTGGGTGELVKLHGAPRRGWLAGVPGMEDARQ